MTKKSLKICLGIFSLILAVGAVFNYLFAPENDVLSFLFGSGTLSLAMAGTTGRVASPKAQSVQDTIENTDTKELDVWDIEKQVSVCRPDNAPLDQLIRMESNTAPTKSQVFEFWSATQNDGIYKISTGIATTEVVGEIPKAFSITLSAAAPDLLVDDVLGCTDIADNGYSWSHRDVVSSATTASAPMVIQIVEKTSATEYKAIFVNGNGGTQITPATGNAYYPTVALANKTFFRIGNAKNEEDVLNDAYNLMPKKDGNFAQRFMKVCSETDYQALIEKEANWGLEQYRSASMYAHRMEVELSQFIGQRRHVTPYADKGEVYYTGGFDDFLKDRIVEHTLTATTNLSLEDIQMWGREVFSNSNGAQERYMFVSPKFMQEILKVPQFNSGNNSILCVTDAMDLKGEKLGFSIRRLDTGYGIINLVMHKGLAGRRDYRGYIIDTTNIRRRVLQSAIAKKVDLEEKLIKKANAIIIEECCGLEIQNADTMRIIDIKGRS